MAPVWGSSEKKIAAFGIAILAVLSLVAFIGSDVWLRLFYPSQIAIPFDPATDAGKVAFMAQQPYQGYYGAWVQFSAACLTVVAAVATVLALHRQTKEASHASLRAIVAEDRRRERDRLSLRVALAVVARAEMRTLEIDYRAAIRQARQEVNATRSMTMVRMGTYHYDAPTIFGLSPDQAVGLGAAAVESVVVVRQDYNLVNLTQAKLRKEQHASANANRLIKPAFHRSPARFAAATWFRNIRGAQRRLRREIEFITNGLQVMMTRHDELVAEIEADRRDFGQTQELR